MAPSSRSWTPGRGIARGCLVQLGATAFVLSWVVCAGAVAFIAPVDRDMRAIVWALAFSSILPVVLVVGAGFMAWNRRRIARLLDAALAPLGLTGQPLMTLGRQYHGIVDGREVHAQFNRGPVFELWVEVPTATRATFLLPSELQRRAARHLGSGEEIPVPGAELTAFSSDRPWVEQLLGQPGVPPALDRLAHDEDPPTAWQRSLRVGPEGLHLHLYRVGLGSLTEDRVRTWHADLSIVATAVEAIGPSPTGQQESSLERQHREKPTALARKAGCFVAAIVVGLMVFSLVVVAVALVLAGG